MTILFPSLALLFLVSAPASGSECPLLQGEFAEDDYRMTIKQRGCDVPLLQGGSLLRFYRFTHLVSGSGETLCFEGEVETKFCATRWVNSELQVDIRTVLRSTGKEFNEQFKVLRCDASPDPRCRYGTVDRAHVIQVTWKHGQAHIPRLLRPGSPIVKEPGSGNVEDMRW